MIDSPASDTAAPETAAHWNRFAGAPRWLAALIFAALIAIMAYGVMGKTGEKFIRSADSTAMKANGLVGDHALYSEIARRVGEGENYYVAATSEQRENSYPTKPFLTVRLPTHAMLIGHMGEKPFQWLGMAIGIITILLWRRRLNQEPDLPFYARFGVFLMVINLIQPLLMRAWVYMHESITGTLIALALVLYRKERQGPTMAVMAVAMAIREPAVPVAMIFGLFALWDRNWRAAAIWMAMGIAFLGGLALHIQAINAVILPSDIASPGWSSSGGWLSYVSFVSKTSILRFAPPWVGAVLVPLSLLGWAAWKGRLGNLTFAVQALFAAFFIALARPDNFYWAVLIVPTLLVGLIFTPAALYQLWLSLLHGRAGAPLRLHGAAADHKS